ncbi:MAG: N-6 DNA methylase [Crocinitomicaceae bacterium]|nr:N-6 DNA methylase [Crocinitomicaceae bacterium]
MHQIAPNGKAAIIAASHFLTNGHQNAKGLRRDLLKKDILEYVILLPAKLFQNTSIPCVAVFLNSKPTKKGGVTFIDASDFVLSAGKKDKILDSGRLLELIGEEGDTIHKRWVSKNEIEKEDYNFSVRRFLMAEEEVPTNVKIVTLGEIVQEQAKENPIVAGTLGRFIRIRDLKDDLLENSISTDEIELTDVPPHSYEIKYPSLLLALRFKSLKPTGIGFSGNNVLLLSQVMIFYPSRQLKI